MPTRRIVIVIFYFVYERFPSIFLRCPVELLHRRTILRDECAPKGFPSVRILPHGKWIGKPLHAVRQIRRHSGAALLPVGHDHRHDVVKVARVVGMDEVAQLVEHDVVDDFLRHDG